MSTNLSTVAPNLSTVAHNLTTSNNSLLYHPYHNSSSTSLLPLDYDEYDPFAYNATTSFDIGLDRIEDLFNASSASSSAPFDTPSSLDFNITTSSSSFIDFNATSWDFDAESSSLFKNISSTLFNLSSSPSTTTITTTTTESPYYNSSDASTNNTSSEAASSLAAYNRFMDESRHWVQRVLVPLVMCLGVVGNSVSMVVLTRRKMRSSTNNYLTALAISDLLYLVFVFSLSLQHHPDIKHPRHWFYWQYVRYAFWLTDASSKYMQLQFVHLLNKICAYIN
ncbi:hypothetical protein Pmani_010984 [Petrolisthes manimaculis]|uniref:G-protein coupled receptors family 1 profile domain-containing protein n=1 Tax=Petrolisthes manimaculis TaxID=1843537 RepID=A0AAE1Q120_9EUCA|nr:hypothetical protein Pmani_010984 [Petrolisthes manimaculis]